MDVPLVCEVLGPSRENFCALVPLNHALAPLGVGCFPLGAMILVITDKHTKLRALLVLKQKKKKEMGRRRAPPHHPGV